MRRRAGNETCLVCGAAPGEPCVSTQLARFGVPIYRYSFFTHALDDTDFDTDRIPLAPRLPDVSAGR